VASGRTACIVPIAEARANPARMCAQREARLPDPAIPVDA
jgi:hypothetical protein